MLALFFVFYSFSLLLSFYGLVLWGCGLQQTVFINNNNIITLHYYIIITIITLLPLLHINYIYITILIIIFCNLQKNTSSTGVLFSIKSGLNNYNCWRNIINRFPGVSITKCIGIQRVGKTFILAKQTKWFKCS